MFDSIKHTIVRYVFVLIISSITLISTKRSRILKKNYSWKLQVFLGMYELFVDNRGLKSKDQTTVVLILTQYIENSIFEKHIYKRFPI